MKTTILAIALNLIFLFGYGYSAFAQQKPSSVRGQAGDDKVSDVQFCEIFRTPDKYVNKKIRFVADYSSGFMQPDFLSHPDCYESIIIPALDVNDTRSADVEKMITKNLRHMDDGISSKGKFVFAGYLRKDLVSGCLPINGLLQNYTMIIQSAHPQSFF